MHPKFRVIDRMNGTSEAFESWKDVLFTVGNDDLEDQYPVDDDATDDTSFGPPEPIEFPDGSSVLEIIPI